VETIKWQTWGCVWLFGHKVKVPCARGLAYDCAPVLSVMLQFVVCGTISVMGFNVLTFFVLGWE